MARIATLSEIGRRSARTLAACLGGLLLIAGLSGAAAQDMAQDMAQDLAQNLEWHHGLSLFGSLKYERGFAHFD